jgi:hypothetical protein
MFCHIPMFSFHVSNMFHDMLPYESNHPIKPQLGSVTYIHRPSSLNILVENGVPFAESDIPPKNCLV